MQGTNRTYGEAVNKASSSFSIEKRVVERLLCDLLNWDKTTYVMQQNRLMPENRVDWFQKCLERLKNGEPLQYITGFEEFYGRRFEVNPSVLIPRPETELLVEQVIKRLKPNAVVLDLCTGSGIIGITIKKERDDCQVTMSDISIEALAVAQKNGEDLKADVRYVCCDLFAEIEGEFDVIVSNPPYISHAEWDVMDASVRDYEPAIALFAERDGLAMYEKIALEAPKKLAEDGILAVEIGYLQGEKVKQLFQQAFPNKRVHVMKDYANLDRIVLVE